MNISQRDPFGTNAKQAKTAVSVVTFQSLSTDKTENKQIEKN